MRIAAVLISTALAGQAGAQEASFKSRFDGIYIGVTGGYDFATTPTRTKLYRGYEFPGMETPVIPNDSVAGAKVGGVGGYNLTMDRLLVGVEARFQYAFSSTSRSTSYRPTPDPTPSAYPSLFQNLEADFWGRIERQAQFDLVARGGIVIDDWLAFGKLGGGIEQVHRASVSDYRHTTFCSDFPWCTIILPLGSYVSSRTLWYGYALAGLGVERNFGNLFARLEAEVTMHQPLRSAYYTPAANLTVGYRF